MQTGFTRERILSEMADHDSKFYLVFDKELPLGVLKVNDGKYTDGTRNSEYQEIERIYFLKEGAGKGLGGL